MKDEGLTEDAIFWNRFIEYLASTDFKTFETKRERIALIFWYESEVQNGGHLQFFENWGVAHAKATVAALREVDCLDLSKALANAIEIHKSTVREPIQTTEGYFKEALDNHFDKADAAFYDRDGVNDLMEKHLDENKDEYAKMFAF